MPKKTISVEVESSGYDLGQALVAVVAAAKSGGASSALTAALGQVVSIVGAVEALPADIKESPAELERGLALSVSDIVAAALGQAETADPA